MGTTEGFTFSVSGFLSQQVFLHLPLYILLIHHKDMKKGSDLKRYRKQFKLSQEKLARLLDVSWITVNRWERGKPEPSFLALKGIEAVLRENFDGGLTNG